MCKKLIDSSFSIQENRSNETIAHVNISSLLFEINLICPQIKSPKTTIVMTYFCMLYSHKRLHAHIDWTKIIMVVDP